eukprot:3389026-Rhodomonas_salina.3
MAVCASLRMAFEMLFARSGSRLAAQSCASFGSPATIDGIWHTSESESGAGCCIMMVLTPTGTWTL